MIKALSVEKHRTQNTELKGCFWRQQSPSHFLLLLCSETQQSSDSSQLQNHQTMWLIYGAFLFAPCNLLPISSVHSAVLELALDFSGHLSVRHGWFHLKPRIAKMNATSDTNKDTLFNASFQNKTQIWSNKRVRFEKYFKLRVWASLKKMDACWQWMQKRIKKALQLWALFHSHPNMDGSGLPLCWFKTIEIFFEILIETEGFHCHFIDFFFWNPELPGLVLLYFVVLSAFETQRSFS